MTGDVNESIQRETSSGNDDSMIDKEQANVSEDEKKNMSSPERNHGKEDFMDEDNMDDEEKKVKKIEGKWRGCMFFNGLSVVL